MLADTTCIDDLGSLREFVHRGICEQNELQLGAFEVTERILLRGGRPCGIYFCLHGPRSVKLTAIWETERNTVLFYGSSGERQMRVQLHQAVPLTAGAHVVQLRYQTPGLRWGVALSCLALLGWVLLGRRLV